MMLPAATLCLLNQAMAHPHFSERKGERVPDIRELRRSVYKISVSRQTPLYNQPWSFQPMTRGHGSGFYIGNNRILTNAHVLAHSRYITVQRDGDPSPEPAWVEHIAHDSDLALLKVSKNNLFAGIRPLLFNDAQPSLHSPVATVGFPLGGEQLSVTQGIVSRIEWRRYVHPRHQSHLMVQVDSAINSGNSGGPVFQGNSVVGVAFQSFTAAENTGYIIPVPVIKRFLRDISTGHYDGHIEPGIRYNPRANTNPAARAFYGLNPDNPGVCITWVHNWSPFHGFLQPGDSLLSINGHQVGVDGKISLGDERISFLHSFDMQLPGETTALRFIRNGQEKQVQMKVRRHQPHLQKNFIYERQAPWHIVGGVTFTVLSRNLLQSFGRQWYKAAPVLLKHLFYHGAYEDSRTFAGGPTGEYVVVSGIFPHPINHEVAAGPGFVVREVNGQRVTDLKSFASLTDKAMKSTYVIITPEGDLEPLVFESRKLAPAHQQIMKSYQIPSLSRLDSGGDGALMISGDNR